MKQRRAFFRGLLWASLLGIFVLALWPMHIVGPIAHSDKLLHLVCFFGLAWLAQLADYSYRELALGLLVFGGFIELSQGLSSYRQASWLDLLADILGVISYLALSRHSSIQKVNRCITAQ
ncbi:MULTISPECIES: hypothetical protein [unclassified Agarivorans]|uniref:hypothetical protein n=1 Tax=unclassified Agarivorans TaxID=2636026 RepID=UPI0026E21E7D|nr:MULTISPECIES: hypothetical protein [unclassified Agarivorans]MDO6684037.1 hypothetical protein [Agarivorans sp. 3_MG-2023]MDO6714229.1 hypothetical protein [Agarivorans sp. 2_MG-2023]